MKFRNFQKGIGLIEVLVTVLIIGTSLLSLSTLQYRSLQQNHGAYLRTQANLLAYDIMDQMRSQNPAPPDAPTTIFSNATINNLTSAVLPGGSGTMTCVQRLCTLNITWSEVADTADPNSTFTYTTRL